MSLELIVGTGIIAAFFFVLFMLTESIGQKTTYLIMTGIQVLMISWLNWQIELGNSVDLMLGINFKILFLIWAGGTLIGILMFIINTVNVANPGHTEGEDKWLTGGNKWD